jgi:hypothetical protein
MMEQAWNKSFLLVLDRQLHHVFFGIWVLRKVCITPLETQTIESRLTIYLEAFANSAFLPDLDLRPLWTGYIVAINRSCYLESKKKHLSQYSSKTVENTII